MRLHLAHVGTAGGLAVDVGLSQRQEHSDVARDRAGALGATEELQEAAGGPFEHQKARAIHALRVTPVTLRLRAAMSLNSSDVAS